MRKLIFTALILFLFMALPVSAHAWEWTIDSAGTLEITGTGPVEDFESAAATPWSGKTVKTVIVHEGITELGGNAFRSCTKLTSVTLPNSLETIGISAFEGCSGLKTVTFGTGLRTVERYAFQDCTGLTGVYITDLAAWCAISYADYSSSPMYHAKALYVNGTLLGGTLEITPGVTKIPKYAFYGCTGITALYLPDSVKTVESDAFTYCSGLTVADLGAGVATVGSAAFSYCSSLSSVSMGDQVTGLGDYAFYHCEALKTADLSAGLQQLGERAFNGCSQLQEVNLPEGLVSMGSYAFYGCTDLKTVTVPGTLTVIPAYAFRGCTGITELELPETVTTIEKYAFYGCTGLTALTIPEALQTLGTYAFYNCTGLEEIQFNALNMKDLTAGNYVFYKAGKTGLEVRISGSVTKIPAYLFYPYSTYCPNVSKIIFEEGSSCTQIGKYAFAGCKSLQEVDFNGPAPVIGTNAFNKVTARCYHPAGWDSAMLQQYGGTITWLSKVIEAFDGTVFTSFAEALKYSDQLRLLGDAEVSATLQQDLYIDLNGFDLSGVLSGGYKIFGMDSTTDRYDGQNVGVFSCTDENGQMLIPRRHCKVDTKRYMAVQEEGGYSFHRFYMGVTHMTLRPGQQGVGFKAVFYGDEAVRSQISATGYQVILGENTPKSQWKDGAFESGKTISLVICNYDAQNYGETVLTAQLCLELTDGTVIESSSATLTLRSLLEQLNKTPEIMTDTQRTRLAQWADQCPILRLWAIENLV